MGSEVLEKFLAANEHSLLSYKATAPLAVVARGGKMKALSHGADVARRGQGLQLSR